MAEQMTVDQAAELMGVSTRHTRRILAAYRRDGVVALAHGHRGRQPPNATPETLRAEVLRLASTRYVGTNHTHLSELLGEREGIDIDRSTLRRILVSAGLNSPRRRRPPQRRVRWQRMPQVGMLIQLDGSFHRWQVKAGPQFTLLVAVDDATGAVVNALFCEREDACNYFVMMQELVQSYGAPVALYVDRHAVFKHTPGSGLAGAPTQFSRAMDELGIQLIFALSPQAKGRVERAAETFQDRLVTELRLAGAATIADADHVLQGFLPRFNARFGVPPRCPEAAYRPLASDVCLDRILCFKHIRKVARDNTVKFQLHTLQLLPEPECPSYSGTAVEVLEGLDGRLSLQHQGRIIPAQEAPPIWYSCEPVTDHPHTLPAAVPVMTIRPSLGRRPSPNWPRIAPKELRMTWSLTTGPQPARWQQFRLGSLRFSKRLAGRPYRRRSVKACPSEE